MIRVAAVGDVHYGKNCRNRLRRYFEALRDRADFLLIAGDLTQSGSIEEAEVLADDLRGASVPVIAVLGNHDYHSNQENEIRNLLSSAGVVTLEGTTAIFEAQGYSVGVIGLKGFGGGFGGSCIAEFGEPEIKAFAHYAKKQAEILRTGLAQLQTDYRFVLMHYSPVDCTLGSERREIYPFLGSCLLGEAIDAVGADGVFHGHAHFGTEKGSTPAGIPVRNVAQTVIQHAYQIYHFRRE